MKKWTRLTALLLCAVLLFSFAACGETETMTTATQEKPFVPASADSLWQKIDETTLTVDSYAITNDVSMTYYYLGNEMKLSGKMSGVRSEQKDNFYSCVEGYTQVVCKELSIETRVDVLEAYYNGKMYRSVVAEGEYDQKFVCEMTPDEFLDAESEDALKDLEITQCTGKEFVQNEDKTWTAKFWGYPKKSVNLFLKNMDFDGEEFIGFGVDVEDMTIEVIANEDFVAKTLKVTLLFEEEEEATAHPDFSFVAEYSGYNEAKFDESKISSTEFTEVDSIAVLDDLEDALDGAIGAANGKFVLETESITTMGTEKEVVTEKNTVTYGKKNGGFYYDVLNETDGETLQIQYQGGVQTYTYGTETESESITDEEAKEIISYLINSANYTSYSVSDVEKQGEGVYLLKIKAPDSSYFESEFEGTGIKVEAAEQEIQVTFEGETLKKMDSKITLGCTYGKNTFTVTYDSLLTFQEVTQEPSVA